MVRKLAIVAGLGFALVAGGVALGAGSKCDSGKTKATGKKISCKCGVHAKAQAKMTPPDPAKLAKCESKFVASCTKAQNANDCVLQTETCAQKEAAADACVASNCASPSGAFLN